MLESYFRQICTLGETAEKSISWLEVHRATKDDLNRALTGLNELPFAIQMFGTTMDKFKTTDPRYHLLYEAAQDLNSTILLLLSGLYKDTFRSLRSFLELNIFALYQFVVDDNKRFQDWLQGKSYTPKVRTLLRALSENNPDFVILNDRLQWNTHVEVLQDLLSKYVHTRGAHHTHTSLDSNVPEFSETGMELGTSLLLWSIRLAGIGFVVKFPMSLQPLPLIDKFAFSQPVGGFLDQGQVDRVMAMFPAEISAILSEICLSNEDAQSLADCVRSMPDLSEKEILESMMRKLESEQYDGTRKEILKSVKDGDLGKAFAIMSATQRLMVRAVTSILFNPFYGPLPKRE